MFATPGDGIPNTGAQWWALIRLWFWGWLSWLLHPIIWLAFGPLKWMAMLSATAAQESTFNPDAVGDAGRSVGILQFYDSTWADLELGDLDRRYKIGWQGWAAGKYVQTAILHDWTWLGRLLIPYYSGGWSRILWVNGIISGLNKSFDEMVSYWDSEGRARKSWNFWRLLSLLLIWPLSRLLGVGFVRDEQ